MTASTNTPGPRPPWTAELTRLRRLEVTIAALADAWADHARDLTERPV